MRFLRLLLFPFSFLYASVAALRNLLFDLGIYKSSSFSIPTINVGNLRVGGTGKTPHIELLIKMFSKSRKLATLSRGYGRKSKGYILADKNVDATVIGDEPMQFFQKYSPNVVIAVGEKRVEALNHLFKDRPEVDLVLLDDAFQHRYVSPTVNILLTSYFDSFTNDYVLPSGNLRELRKGAERADVVIVTKCPNDLVAEDFTEIDIEISSYTKRDVPIYHSYVDYGNIYDFNRNEVVPEGRVIVLAGIADNDFFFDHVESTYEIIARLSYPDHHNYSDEDIELVLSTLENVEDSVRLVTTEKDYVRLKALDLPLKVKQNLYFWPIEVRLCGDELSQLQSLIEAKIII